MPKRDFSWNIGSKVFQIFVCLPLGGVYVNAQTIVFASFK